MTRASIACGASVTVLGLILSLPLSGQTTPATGSQPATASRTAATTTKESPQLTQARIKATEDSMENLKTALAAFEIDMGRYPTQAEGLSALAMRPAGLGAVWKGPYIRGVPLDPWGRAFIYRIPGQADPNGFDLISPGPDGKEGTEDDIRSK